MIYILLSSLQLIETIESLVKNEQIHCGIHFYSILVHFCGMNKFWFS